MKQIQNKLHQFLQTKEYADIKDIFIDKLSDSFFIDIKMLPANRVTENISKLCDTFLLNSITKMYPAPAPQPVKSSKAMPERDYYIKWVSWVQQTTKIQSYSLKEAIEELETIVEHAGKQVYEGLSEDATPEARAQVIDNIAHAFIAIVQFLLTLKLDPVDVLLQSIYDCELEEYGAMMHLVDNVLYKLDTSYPVHNFTITLQNTAPDIYQEFIEAIYEIWGTFNIFRVKKDICSPAAFEKKLIEIISPSK